MNFINAKELTQYYGANLVLDHIHFEINEGDKVGLIGSNGSGKTTLMRLLAGRLVPDEGQLMIKKQTKIGYVAQIPTVEAHCTVLDVLTLGLKDLNECRNQMSELERMMGDPAYAGNEEELDRLLKKYASLQERFEREGGYEMEASIDQVASGLGISKEAYSLPFQSLSGGEQTRVVLASQLIVKPELLLLDEPTNHLDLTRTEWLESFLRDYTGTCVIISHDRYFLDRVITKTMELEDGQAFMSTGGYTVYMKEKEERLLQQFNAYQEQQKKIKKMKETIRQLEEWGQNGDNEKFFKRAASMRRALERMERIKRPILERRQAEFDLDIQDRSGRRALVFEQLQKSYGTDCVLKEASGLLEYGDKIALLGHNGSGKTTLFKLLLGKEKPDAGFMEWGSRVEIGYLAQQEEPSNPKETMLDFFKKNACVEEGEARGLLARYLFYGPAVFRTVGQLSGGEWTRLRLALLMHHKPNLLLLDEPTNHLDIASREALEEALSDYTGTILAISHDRYFVNKLAERIWELQDGRLSVYQGNYDDYREKKMEKLIKETETSTRSKQQYSDRLRGGATRQLEQRANHRDAERNKIEHVASDDSPERSRSRKNTKGDGRSAAIKLQRLEQDIAELEAKIQELDLQMEAKSVQIAAPDQLNTLEQQWTEREALVQRRDLLLAEWLELS
ncbi:ribosomal protection-like ABC-F family protein [Paenibacillus faecalis]|uniref:ribosomal protection-like ABC-F family protein n=1 Tax=Paenibacillus faecalis TaxID=2079532 RepID=UPI000D101ABF|nr:ABC-F type ribosomal protection protein [Paenibacillus faecalis]